MSKKQKTVEVAPTVQVEVAPTVQVEVAPTVQVEVAPTVQVEVAPTVQVEFPPELVGEGVKLAKSTMKGNKSFAELASLCIVEKVDWQGLIRFSFIQAGGVARDARGAITNCSKFVAASLAVRQGKLGACEFANLKTDVASAAFKQAGGMKDGGLDPEKWVEAYRLPAAKAETGGTANSATVRPPLSSDEFMLALALQKRSEMTLEGRKAVASAMLEGMTKADL